MINKFKFNSIFGNLHIKPIVSEEKDKYLSTASIKELQRFIPNIDTARNIDLLPIAFDACVVNRVNKNGDVIDSATAYEMTKYFVNKPINIEHERMNVIGCILNANFTKFATNEEISEDKVKDLKEPFNITLGGIIWKIVNPSVSDLIENSSDPTSEDYMSVSASWELGFTEYDLVVLDGSEKNIENGEIITDKNNKEKLSKNLKAFGGTGKIDNNRYIYRKVIGEVIPLGIGLTSAPAADVQGIATELTKDRSAEEIESAADDDQNNTSHLNNLNVKEDGAINRIIMKIENINQITDELLKTVKASSVTDFIQDELKKASEVFVVEKNEKDNAIKSAQEKYEALSTESSNLKEELDKVKATLTRLEDEKLAKAQEEAFNLRMSSFDTEFDLSDEDRQVLAADIKDLNEEAFAAYKKKIEVLMKEKNKAAKKAKDEAMKTKASEEAKVEETKANEEVKVVTASQEVSATEVVEEALEKSQVEKTSIPNSSSANEPTLKEKFSKAFAFEGFEIK